MSLTIAMFFLHFWRRTRDRFVWIFALPFLIEAANRSLRVSVAGWLETSPSFYMTWLLTYLLIIVAILDKNHKKVLSRAP